MDDEHHKGGVCSCQTNFTLEWAWECHKLPENQARFGSSGSAYSVPPSWVSLMLILSQTVTQPPVMWLTLMFIVLLFLFVCSSVWTIVIPPKRTPEPLRHWWLRGQPVGQAQVQVVWEVFCLWGNQSLQIHWSRFVVETLEWIGLLDQLDYMTHKMCPLWNHV